MGSKVVNSFEVPWIYSFEKTILCTMKFLAIASLCIVAALAEPEAEAESRYLGTYGRQVGPSFAYRRNGGFYGSNWNMNKFYNNYAVYQPYGFNNYNQYPAYHFNGYNRQFYKREAEAEPEAEPGAEAEAEADAEAYYNRNGYRTYNYFN